MAILFCSDLTEMLQFEGKVEFSVNDETGLSYLYYVQGSEAKNSCEFLYGAFNSSGCSHYFKDRFLRWPKAAERGNPFPHRYRTVASSLKVVRPTT